MICVSFVLVFILLSVIVNKVQQGPEQLDSDLNSCSCVFFKCLSELSVPQCLFSDLETDAGGAG